MTIATFIGGRFSSTLAATDLGITETGYELALDVKGETIAESDMGGQTLLDFFFRGTDVSNVFDSLEYKTGTISAIYPWGSLGTQGIIARLGSAMSGAHVLTSTAGTPAASTPATLTGSRAIVPPGFNTKLLYNSRLRKVPIRFQYLPSDSMVHWAQT